MTTAQDFETSALTIDNSSSQDHCYPDDQSTSLTISPLLKPFNAILRSKY